MARSVPKSNRGGKRGGGNEGLNPSDILGTKVMMSQRHQNVKQTDETLGVFKDFHDEYGSVIEEILLAELKPKASGVMAYYDGANIAINEKYFNDKMEAAYKECVKSGYHPSNGNKTGLQAVVAHEIGHQLTDIAADKMGITTKYKLQEAATKICNEARKLTSYRGVVLMEESISGYAKTSNAEAIAESVADVYCNGKKAHSASKAIVSVLNKYIK